MKKVFILLFIIFLSPIFFNNLAYSQTDTPAPTPDYEKLRTDTENKIASLKKQAITYSTQISIMENQVKLTEYRIEATKQQIISLVLDIDTATKKISTLSDSLNKITEVLLNRIVATYEAGSVKPLEILLSSSSATNLLARLNYLRIAQAHDKILIYDVQQAKNDYVNQKDIYEGKKKQVEALKIQLLAYTAQLAQEKQATQQLLDATESQIAQAQAELSALSNFARSVSGGAHIIAHSDLSDSWGKYYNQRDANWGNNSIGLSGESIWDVGCLLTSYAMVITHYGGSNTPADVAANSGNFSFGTAYFNKPGPAANGHSVEGINNPSLQELKDALNSEAVVIAGLSRDGGPYPVHYSDHWVVLRSVDGDGFKINDPEYQDAMNVSLNDHYSGWTIIESRIYR